MAESFIHTLFTQRFLSEAFDCIPKAVLGTYQFLTQHKSDDVVRESCIKFMFVIWRKCKKKRASEENLCQGWCSDDPNRYGKKCAHQIKKDVERKRIEQKVIGVGNRFFFLAPPPVFHRNATRLTAQSLSKFKFRFTVSVKLCFAIFSWKLPSGHRLFVTVLCTRPNVRLALEQHIRRTTSSYVIVEYEFVNGHWPWLRCRAFGRAFVIHRRLGKQRQQRHDKSHRQLLTPRHERAWTAFAFLGHRTRRDMSRDERL